MNRRTFTKSVLSFGFNIYSWTILATPLPEIRIPKAKELIKKWLDKLIEDREKPFTDAIRWKHFPEENRFVFQTMNWEYKCPFLHCHS